MLYENVFGSEVMRIIFCSVTVPRCHPGQGHGPGSAQLSQGVGGLHVVVFFNSRPLCPEVTQGSHVKGLCIERLKTTYVNSGLQPKLPSCLAETGS